jgi:hypothetical protein
MSDSIWAAVIGGAATIVAAIITVLWKSGTKPQPPDKLVNATEVEGTKPQFHPEKANNPAAEPTEFGQRRLWKEMKKGALLEERDGKLVLHKDGVDLLYPQRRTVSGLESAGFIRPETTADGNKRWLPA